MIFKNSIFNNCGRYLYIKYLTFFEFSIETYYKKPNIVFYILFFDFIKCIKLIYLILFDTAIL